MSVSVWMCFVALHCTNCTNSFCTLMIMDLHFEESKKYYSVCNRGKMQSDCAFYIKEREQEGNDM